MNKVDRATNYGVDARRETSALGDEKSSAAATHDVESSPSSRPLGIGKDETVPFHPLSLRDVEVPAPMASPGDNLQQILEGGIGKAYFGRTDGITDEMWDDVYNNLANMPSGNARGILQTIANVIAVDCFGPDGNIDIGRIRGWMDFLGKPEIFREKPCCFIPHAKFACSQICVVLERLSDNKNGARDRLNDIKGDPSSYGQSILDVMFPDMGSPLKPAVAILASLLTPHRQTDLETCAIDSLLNAETQNHPERLIEIYAQMLGGGDQITFPSGYAAELQPIIDGFITVDLKNGGRKKDNVFWAITSGDSAEIAEQVTIWQTAGIKYTESTDKAEKYKLGLPIHNMNDVLFAHLFQASSFGNEKINDSDENGIMLIYAGCKEGNEMYSLGLSVKTEEPNFLCEMGSLKWHARAQRGLGHHYMRVLTGSIRDTGFYFHAENIDIAALVDLNLYHMETGKVYVIGDRNAWGRDMSQDIPHLAVRKVDGTPPTYEFGTFETLLSGDTFKEERIFSFNVYATDSKVRDTQYWEQFNP